jgi:hypothetical protein
MNLYVELVKGNEFAKIDFEWVEELQAMEVVREIIRKNYSPGWSGLVLIDNKPIDLDARDLMFEAEAFYGNDGGVDFKVGKLHWKYPGSELS